MTSFLPPIVETLFELAKEIADFADANYERLGEDYDELLQCELKLLAFGNLLAAFNRDAFLQEEIDDAYELLHHFRQKIGGAQ